MSLNGNKRWEEGLPSSHLSDNEIHIWDASLQAGREVVAKYSTLLSADEKKRARRFYFKADENRFITGRGILRTLLGRVLKLEPHKIKFQYGEHGKPQVEYNFPGKPFEFNLSHAKDRVVYIFNWGEPVGIDIEHVRPMKDMDDFALQFFTPNEYQLIYSLPKDQKQETFFKIWTCKEAFLKANGSGLTLPINMYEIYDISDSPKIHSIAQDLQTTAPWNLEMFIPAPGYQAAIAIKEFNKNILVQNYNYMSMI
jgi:4'-phosphopantetheinyl transferase